MTREEIEAALVTAQRLGGIAAARMLLPKLRRQLQDLVDKQGEGSIKCPGCGPSGEVWEIECQDLIMCPLCQGAGYFKPTDVTRRAPDGWIPP